MKSSLRPEQKQKTCQGKPGLIHSGDVRNIQRVIVAKAPRITNGQLTCAEKRRLTRLLAMSVYLEIFIARMANTESRNIWRKPQTESNPSRRRNMFGSHAVCKHSRSCKRARESIGG